MMATDSGDSRRWPRRVAAAVTATVLLWGGGVLLRGDPPVATPTTRTTASAPPRVPKAKASATTRGAPSRALATPQTAHAAVTALLAKRASAVLKRDRTAYAASLDPAAGSFRAKQLALFANLAPVPLDTWSYVVDDAEGDDRVTDAIRARHTADEIYVPPVGLRYKLRGFDRQPTELTLRVTFVRRDARWYLASDSDFDRPGHATARELWDFGPVDVVRTARSLVIGPRGRRIYLQSVARDTDAAVPRVTAVWGSGWPQRVVVLVPTSQRQVSDLIGTRTVLSQIAAVAVSQVAGKGGAYRAVGSRIIVNPPNFDQLTSLGRRVVLAHEVTHVASRDTTGPTAPAWLVEGFADYVGYRGTSVDPKTAARELGLDVRRKTAPKLLPSETDFLGSNAKLAQSYEGAWLACRMIAQRHGEPALLAFYKAVGSSKASASQEAVRAAMKTHLSTTPEAFTIAWRAYVKETLR